MLLSLVDQAENDVNRALQAVRKTETNHTYFVGTTALSLILSPLIVLASWLQGAEDLWLTVIYAALFIAALALGATYMGWKARRQFAAFKKVCSRVKLAGYVLCDSDTVTKYLCARLPEDVFDARIVDTQALKLSQLDSLAQFGPDHR